MADNDINPYAAPNPIEAHKPTVDAASGTSALKPRIRAVLWWCYFAFCALLLAFNLKHLADAAMHSRDWGLAISPLGLVCLIQALGQVSLLGYLCRLPLLRPFFWGLVFFANAGVVLYATFQYFHFIANEDTSQLVAAGNAGRHYAMIAVFILTQLAHLPQLFALWRYSSSSSPVWREPRMRWKGLARKLVDAIAYLRRA